METETVGFEPTCRLPDNLISSQARYDHFDTSPDMKLADQIIRLHFIIIKEEADSVNRFPPVLFVDIRLTMTGLIDLAANDSRFCIFVTVIHLLLSCLSNLQQLTPDFLPFSASSTLAIL